MPDSSFWHDLAGEFEQLPNTLAVQWQYTSGSPGWYNYTIDGASRHAREKFKLIARKAGAAVDQWGEGVSLEVWLEELRTHDKDPRNQGEVFGPEVLKDGTKVYHQLGKIPNAVEASASRCLEFEMLPAEAERQSKGGGTRPEQPNPQIASSPNGGSTQAVANSSNRSAQRGAVNDFIAKLADAGRKIIRKNIWTVAGYKDRTEFERWQRGDSLTTRSATASFTRVLNMTPEDFIRALDKKTVK